MLTEFADEVVGFEREASLVSMAREVVRDCRLVEVGSLRDIEASGTFDVILVCTVLQHLADSECAELAQVIGRGLRPGGVAVVIESTDTEGLDTIGDPTSTSTFLSRPRTVSKYASMFAGLQLEAVRDRVLERSYDTFAGSVMTFRRPT